MSSNLIQALNFKRRNATHLACCVWSKVTMNSMASSLAGASKGQVTSHLEDQKVAQNPDLKSNSNIMNPLLIIGMSDLYIYIPLFWKQTTVFFWCFRCCSIPHVGFLPVDTTKSCQSGLNGQKQNGSRDAASLATWPIWPVQVQGWKKRTALTQRLIPLAPRSGVFQVYIYIYVI